MTFFRQARTQEIVIAEFAMPPHFNVPAHDHSPPHMLVMLAGSLVERHGDSEQQCDAGAIRYSPGGDKHSQIRAGAHGAHCLVLEARAFPELRLTARMYVPASEVCHEVSNLERCLLVDNCVSLARVEDHALQLFSLVRARARPTRTVHHEWVARIQPFLDSLVHAASPLSAAAIFVDRNPSIVARLFRATHGVSVQRYYRRRQIDRAWFMLSNTTTSLSAISAECGFTDQSHMTRTFSRDAGITPAQLRHNVQAGIENAAHWYRSFASNNHS